MLGKIKRKMKSRLNQVINVRMNQEMDKQRAIVESLSESFIQLSADTAKQNQIITQTLEDILKRLQILEDKVKNQ